MDTYRQAFIQKNLIILFKPLGSLRLTEDNKDRILEGAYSDTENELLIVSKINFCFNIDKVVSNKNAYPVHLEKVTNGRLVDYNKNSV